MQRKVENGIVTNNGIFFFVKFYHNKTRYWRGSFDNLEEARECRDALYKAVGKHPLKYNREILGEKR